MTLHGQNLIGSTLSSQGEPTIFGFDPRESKSLEPGFHTATTAEINRAMELAAEAFPKFRKASSENVSELLSAIADEIVALGDGLIARATTETGLGRVRLVGERTRTVNQLLLFAKLVQDGSFVDARIDRALPDRTPQPRPDLRRMLVPVGPVIVFGASNFPLAFSVGGGDTASALAARNPVVVKADPAHPGVSELVGMAIAKAVRRMGFPEGVFSMVHSSDPDAILDLIRHPAARAVAFTGSPHAGRAIFDAANRRPVPIPAFVEMGSNNPVFILPGALNDSIEHLANLLFESIHLGVGQFCTCPGLIVGKDSSGFLTFCDSLKSNFRQAPGGTMIHPGILKNYNEALSGVMKIDGVTVVPSEQTAVSSRMEATPTLLETDARTLLAQPNLSAEIFGPSAILIHCRSDEEMALVAESLTGTLTASIHGVPSDLTTYRDLVDVLETKAGRLIFNGFPTGVEVSSAMHHGGPYPATADAKFTSVGTAAILRFLRPLCFQDFPQEALRTELQNENPAHLWRRLDGQLTQQDC